MAANFNNIVLLCFLYSVLRKNYAEFYTWGLKINWNYMAYIRKVYPALCPINNICPTNDSAIRRNEYVNGCCTDCSCSEDCGIDVPCCHPNSMPKPSPLDDEECLSNVIGNTTHPFFETFFMVTKCPVQPNLPPSYYDNEEHCGDQYEYPFGTLYPVFSKSAGRIYKNGACAKCHNISDGVTWIPQLLCKIPPEDKIQIHSEGKDLYTITIGSIEELLESSGYCRIQFTYPVPYSDVFPQKCYMTLQPECSMTHAMFPLSIKIGSDTLKLRVPDELELCKKYIYISDKVVYTPATFLNIFCGPCAAMHDLTYVNCPLNIFDQSKKSDNVFIRNLTVLDFERLDILREQTFDEPKTVCLRKNKKKTNCRRVRCPVGQMFDTEEKCVYMVDGHVLQKYKITLKLTPLTELHFDEIKQAPEGLCFNQTWTLAEFYAVWKSCTSLKSKCIDFIVAICYNIFPDTDLSVVLEMVKSHLNLNMEYVYSSGSNSTFFDVDLYYFNNLCGTRNGIHCVPHWVFWARNEGLFDSNDTKMVMDLVSRVPDLTFVQAQEGSYIDFHLKITKLLFCDTIQLTPEEYSLHVSNTVLFYKPLGTFLLDGQFYIDLQKNLSICVQDSIYSVGVPLLTSIERIFVTFCLTQFCLYWMLDEIFSC